jgi:hypothetical protein
MKLINIAAGFEGLSLQFRIDDTQVANCVIKLRHEDEAVTVIQKLREMADTLEETEIAFVKAAREERLAATKSAENSDTQE